MTSLKRSSTFPARSHETRPKRTSGRYYSPSISGSTTSKLRESFWVYFVAAACLCQSSVVHCLLVVNDNAQTHAAWGTGWVSDPEHQGFSVSTLFKDGSNRNSFSGVPDTNCIIAMEVLDFSHPTWEELELQDLDICFGGGLMLNTASGGGNMAAILGLSGKTPLMQVIDKSPATDGSPLLTPGNQWDLPINSIPVAFEAAEDSMVLVGLHHVSELAHDGTLSNNNLIRLVNYWKELTIPQHFEEQISFPHIVKMDASSGEQQFHLLMEVDGSATIAAIRYASGLILVAGSVKGVGDGYGSSGLNNDWDGYLTFINPTTGVYSNQKLPIRFASSAGASGKDPDDFIRDMCILDDMVVVVGRTEGTLADDDIAGGAFAIAVDFNTNQILWSHQIPGDDIEATKCVIVPSDGVYVGGHMAFLIQDVVVTKLDLATGATLWTQQLDSSEYQGDIREDQLVAIEQNNNASGGVIIVFNSIQSDSGLCDIIMMDLAGSTGDNSIRQKDWEHQPDTDQGDIELEHDAGLGNQVSQDSSQGKDEGLTGKGVDNVGNNYNEEEEEEEKMHGTQFRSESGKTESLDEKEDKTIIIVFTTMPVVLALLLGVEYLRSRKKGSRQMEMIDQVSVASAPSRSVEPKESRNGLLV